MIHRYSSVFIIIQLNGGFHKWGTPKSSILMGISLINHPAIGGFPFVETLKYSSILTTTAPSTSCVWGVGLQARRGLKCKATLWWWLGEGDLHRGAGGNFSNHLQDEEMPRESVWTNLATADQKDPKSKSPWPRPRDFPAGYRWRLCPYSLKSSDQPGTNFFFVSIDRSICRLHCRSCNCCSIDLTRLRVKILKVIFHFFDSSRFWSRLLQRLSSWWL